MRIINQHVGVKRCWTSFFCGILVAFTVFSVTVAVTRVDAQSGGGADKTCKQNQKTKKYEDNGCQAQEGKCNPDTGKCTLQKDTEGAAQGLDANGNPVGSIKPDELKPVTTPPPAPSVPPPVQPWTNPWDGGDFYKAFNPSPNEPPPNTDISGNQQGESIFDRFMRNFFSPVPLDYTEQGTSYGAPDPKTLQPTGDFDPGGITGKVPENLGQSSTFGNYTDTGDYGVTDQSPGPLQRAWEATRDFFAGIGRMAAEGQPGSELTAPGDEQFPPTDTADQLRQPPSNPEFTGVPGAAMMPPAYPFNSPKEIADLTQKASDAANKATIASKELENLNAEYAFKRDNIYKRYGAVLQKDPKTGKDVWMFPDRQSLSQARADLNEWQKNYDADTEPLREQMNTAYAQYEKAQNDLTKVLYPNPQNTEMGGSPERAIALEAISRYSERFGDIGLSPAAQAVAISALQNQARLENFIAQIDAGITAAAYHGESIVPLDNGYGVTQNLALADAVALRDAAYKDLDRVSGTLRFLDSGDPTSVENYSDLATTPPNQLTDWQKATLAAMNSGFGEFERLAQYREDLPRLLEERANELNAFGRPNQGWLRDNAPRVLGDFARTDRDVARSLENLNGIATADPALMNSDSIRAITRAMDEVRGELGAATETVRGYQKAAQDAATAARQAFAEGNYLRGTWEGLKANYNSFVGGVADRWSSQIWGEKTIDAELARINQSTLTQSALAGKHVLDQITDVGMLAGGVFGIAYGVGRSMLGAELRAFSAEGAGAFPGITRNLERTGFFEGGYALREGFSVLPESRLGDLADPSLNSFARDTELSRVSSLSRGDSEGFLNRAQVVRNEGLNSNFGTREAVNLAQDLRAASAEMRTWQAEYEAMASRYRELAERSSGGLRRGAEARANQLQANANAVKYARGAYDDAALNYEAAATGARADLEAARMRIAERYVADGQAYENFDAPTTRPQEALQTLRNQLAKDAAQSDRSRLFQERLERERIAARERILQNVPESERAAAEAAIRQYEKPLGEYGYQPTAAQRAALERAELNYRAADTTFRDAELAAGRRPAQSAAEEGLNQVNRLRAQQETRLSDIRRDVNNARERVAAKEKELAMCRAAASIAGAQVAAVNTTISQASCAKKEEDLKVANVEFASRASRLAEETRLAREQVNKLQQTLDKRIESARIARTNAASERLTSQNAISDSARAVQREARTEALKTLEKYGAGEVRPGRLDINPDFNAEYRAALAEQARSARTVSEARVARDSAARLVNEERALDQIALRRHGEVPQSIRRAYNDAQALRIEAEAKYQTLRNQNRFSAIRDTLQNAASDLRPGLSSRIVQAVKNPFSTGTKAVQTSMALVQTFTTFVADTAPAKAAAAMQRELQLAGRLVQQARETPPVQKLEQNLRDLGARVGEGEAPAGSKSGKLAEAPRASESTAPSRAGETPRPAGTPLAESPGAQGVPAAPAAPAAPLVNNGASPFSLNNVSLPSIFSFSPMGQILNSVLNNIDTLAGIWDSLFGSGLGTLAVAPSDSVDVASAPSDSVDLSAAPAPAGAAPAASAPAQSVVPSPLATAPSPLTTSPFAMAPSPPVGGLPMAYSSMPGFDLLKNIFGQQPAAQHVAQKQQTPQKAQQAQQARSENNAPQSFDEMLAKARSLLGEDGQITQSKNNGGPVVIVFSDVHGVNYLSGKQSAESASLVRQVRAQTTSMLNRMVDAGLAKIAITEGHLVGDVTDVGGRYKTYGIEKRDVSHILMAQFSDFFSADYLTKRGAALQQSFKSGGAAAMQKTILADFYKLPRVLKVIAEYQQGKAGLTNAEVAASRSTLEANISAVFGKAPFAATSLEAGRIQANFVLSHIALYNTSAVRNVDLTNNLDNLFKTTGVEVALYTLGGSHLENRMIAGDIPVNKIQDSFDIKGISYIIVTSNAEIAAGHQSIASDASVLPSTPVEIDNAGEEGGAQIGDPGGRIGNFGGPTAEDIAEFTNAQSQIIAPTSPLGGGIVNGLNSLLNSAGVTVPKPTISLTSDVNSQKAIQSGNPFLTTNGNTVTINIPVNVPAPSPGAPAPANPTVQPQCVTADTRLRRRRRLGDGSYEYDEVMIKDVEEGDEVQSLDQKTGRLVWSRVNALIETGIQPIVTITTQSNRQIRTTAVHPYLVRAGEYRGKKTAHRAQKQYRFEVDQSIRIEEFSADSFVALGSGERSYVLAIPRKVKQALRDNFRHHNKPKLFKAAVFASAIAEAMKRMDARVHELVIDIEYKGYEKVITNIVRTENPAVFVSFDKIGKESPAHFAAYGTYQKRKAADAAATLEMLASKTENALRATFPTSPLSSGLGPVGPQASSDASRIHGEDEFVKKGKWVKAAELKIGQEIAVVYGDTPAWERVVKIEEQLPESVYDIEIEGTHNFIGNDIVAHNTSVTANGQQPRLPDSGGQATNNAPRPAAAAPSAPTFNFQRLTSNFLPDTAAAIAQLRAAGYPAPLAAALAPVQVFSSAIKNAISGPALGQQAPQVIDAMPVAIAKPTPQIPSFSLSYRLRAPSDLEKLPVDQISRDRLVQEVNDVMGRLNKFGNDTLPALTGKAYRPAGLNTVGLGHDFYANGVVFVDIDQWILQSQVTPVYLSDVRVTLAHEVGHHFQRELGESGIGLGRQGWLGSDRSFFSLKQKIEDQADQFAALMVADPEADLLYEGALPQIYSHVYDWGGGGENSTHPDGPSRALRIYEAVKFENIGDALKSNPIQEKNAFTKAQLAEIWGLDRAGIENLQKRLAEDNLANTKTGKAVSAWLADYAQNPFRFYSPDSWTKAQNRDEAYRRSLGVIARIAEGKASQSLSQEDERAAIEYGSRILNGRPIGMFATENTNKIRAYESLVINGYADTAIGKALEKWMQDYQNRSFFAKLHPVFDIFGAGQRDATLAVDLESARIIAGVKSNTSEPLAAAKSPVEKIIEMYNSGGTASPKAAFGVVDAAKWVAGLLAKPAANEQLLATNETGKVNQQGDTLPAQLPTSNPQPPTQCVTADTKLRRRRRRADGSYEYDDVMIKDVVPGDEVQSLDQKTGRLVWSRVNGIIETGIQSILEIRTQSGREIRTTNVHPYLVRTGEYRAKTSAHMSQKQYRFEVDQSIRIEEFSKDSIIGIANKEYSFAATIPREVKQMLRDALRHYNKPRTFKVAMFAAAIVETLKRMSVRIHELVIDIEYKGYEDDITNIIKQAYPAIEIHFDTIGKRSPAHYTANFTHRKGRKADYRVTIGDLMLKTENALRTLQLQGKPASSESYRAPLKAENAPPATFSSHSPKGGKDPVGRTRAPLMQGRVHNQDEFVKKGSWVEAGKLKKGQQIGVVYGDTPAWEEIKDIKHLPEESVYDIEIEGTHNFIGNDIVAHNTSVTANSQQPTDNGIQAVPQPSAEPETINQKPVTILVPGAYTNARSVNADFEQRPYAGGVPAMPMQNFSLLSLLTTLNDKNFTFSSGEDVIECPDVV